MENNEPKNIEQKNDFQNEQNNDRQGKSKKVNKKTVAIISIVAGAVLLIALLLCIFLLLPKSQTDEGEGPCKETEIVVPKYGTLSPKVFEYDIFKYQVYSDGKHCSVIGLINEKDRFFLEEINIPETINGYTVVSIGIRAFSGSQAMKKLTLPYTLTIIGPEAFSNCFSLEGVHIPDSVAVIDYCAFSCCNSLRDVNIPESLVRLGAGAFEACMQINGTDYENAKYLGKGDNPYFALVFVQPYAKSFTVHKSTMLVSTRTGLYVEEIKVEEENCRYSAIDGNLYSKCGNTIISYANGKKDSSFTLPNGVEKIEPFAFSGSKNLTSVNLSSGVVLIGEYAFSGCTNLSEVTLPAELRRIDEYAFYSCNALTNIYFNGSEKKWKSVNISNGNYPLSEVIVHCESEQ